MQLISQLVSELAVSEMQAKGGAGLIFKLAQGKLSDGEFAQIRDKVSGIDDMLSASSATESHGLMGAAGGLMSSVGGGTGDLGALPGLAGGFDELGMDGSMIGKFVPIVLDAVRNQGGNALEGMLRGVLSPDWPRIPGAPAAATGDRGQAPGDGGQLSMRRK